MKVLAAADKFKGTATSAEIGAAIVRGARAADGEARAVTLSDGGEGLLDVYGGPNRDSTVTGPLGLPVDAAWRLSGGTAVVECARASGLTLAGGAAGNDPVAATSAGTGELIEAAVQAGARRVVVGLGGSACTDGGIAAVEALSAATLHALRDRTVELQICCDVTTTYLEAAVVYGPQKGAGAEQVAQLTVRLRAARERLLARFGVDVATAAGQPARQAG